METKNNFNLHNRHHNIPSRASWNSLHTFIPFVMSNFVLTHTLPAMRSK